MRLVTHRGGFWKWRMQGAALTLAEEIRRLVASWGRPDVVMVSDKVHVAALVGLAGDALRGVPLAVYFHENRLTYPTPDGAPADHTYALTNWLSMAAADRVVFNSEHHRRDVFAALPRLLRRFPDHRHSGFLDDVAARTSVLPVGIDTDRFRGPRPLNDPPVVVWNHRWEYDKDPEAFFRALDAVADAGVDFTFRVGPPALLGPDRVVRDPRRQRLPRPAPPLRHRGEHRPRRRAAADTARRHVQRFDWHHVAPRYDQLLEDLATTRPADIPLPATHAR